MCNPYKGAILTRVQSLQGCNPYKGAILTRVQSLQGCNPYKGAILTRVQSLQGCNPYKGAILTRVQSLQGWRLGHNVFILDNFMANCQQNWSHYNNLKCLKCILNRLLPRKYDDQAMAFMPFQEAFELFLAFRNRLGSKDDRDLKARFQDLLLYPYIMAWEFILWISVAVWKLKHPNLFGN